MIKKSTKERTDWSREIVRYKKFNLEATSSQKLSYWPNRVMHINKKKGNLQALNQG
jgi:hypothetical protein